MTTKIVEVLTKILEGLNQNYSLEEVNDTLKREKNFDQQTLSAAFSLVYDKVLSNKIPRKGRKKNSNNFRILSEEEKDILGQDNSSYLMHLSNVGLIDAFDFDLIIEQISLFPGDDISKEDINWMVLFSLVDFNSEILPGSRVLLYSSDTIN
ncbi:hypothetical protein BMS3Abin04_00265 [bacterium BMS3Abin04]|nr:hypothetical protein BMS3Abin04_00265 [bacterium BMS3Abin04]